MMVRLPAMRRITSIFRASLLLLFVPLAAHPSNQQLTFDVASIRRSESLQGGGSMGVRPGGTFVVRNVAARALISLAYDVPMDRVLDAPAWTSEERYIIDAKAEGLSTMAEARPRVLALLQQRFNMAARKEKRELPVYLLVLARQDGRLGPRLKRNDLDCLNAEARAKAVAAAAPGTMVCGLTFDTGRFQGGALALRDLIGTLTSASGRPVLDRTGLAGTYDVDLEWAASPEATDRVPIFTAVQEQLGLKLESATAPLDVIVVDRIDRPSEN